MALLEIGTSIFGRKVEEKNGAIGLVHTCRLLFPQLNTRCLR